MGYNKNNEIFFTETELLLLSPEIYVFREYYKLTKNIRDCVMRVTLKEEKKIKRIMLIRYHCIVTDTKASITSNKRITR